MESYRFKPGSLPLLVSIPHAGIGLPEALRGRMTEGALALPDTDWHVDRLYDFLDDLGASTIVARQSRYVIDLNRAPDSRPLYPGASNTELCPTSTFGEAPVYREDEGPSQEEIETRLDMIWRPYHAKIGEEIERIKAAHGIAVLWDAHSIRSEVPRFFEGRLPDLNLGTAGGESASAELTGLLGAVAREAEALGFSHAIDGRFKGGYITRSFGAPDQGIHAVQLELSQITYMDEDPPYRFREDLAEKVRPVLQGLLDAALAWAELEASS
ncbi:MAG: N-formylglutamate deformylase [Kiloniellales bacterium]|nr:N-formylglutamate deformylase [Kiloniellales bacterium]